MPLRLFRMNRLIETFAFVWLLAVGATIYAQEVPLPGSQPPPANTIPPGPTMAETKAWLESEALPMVGGSEITQDRSGTVTRMSDKLANLSVQDCRLAFDMDTMFSIGSASYQRPPVTGTYHIIVPLKDLDIAGVKTAAAAPAARGDVTYPRLRIKTRAAAGKTIKTTGGSKGEEASDGISFFVRNDDDGERVAKAIRRAAILCGAPPSPF